MKIVLGHAMSIFQVTDNIVSKKERLHTLLDNGKQNPVANLLVSVLSTLAEIDYKNRRGAQTEGIAVPKPRANTKGGRVEPAFPTGSWWTSTPILLKK